MMTNKHARATKVFGVLAFLPIIVWGAWVHDGALLGCGLFFLVLVLLEL